MLVAMAVLPLMDAVAKDLTTRLSVLEVVWARYAFHFAIILPVVVARHRLGALVTVQWPRQLLRGGLLLCATLLFFSALSLMPMADALTLFFVSPLVLTVLAAHWLREHVGYHRWIAVAVGFVGVLVVIRPGIAAIDAGTLYAIAAGVAHAVYLVTTRQLAGRTPPLVTLLYTSVVGLIVMSVVVVSIWVTPSVGDARLMVAMGGLAALGHFLIIRAFDLAPASMLAPLGYSEIVMATAVGFVWFGDFPDLWTVVGAVVIIASGAYVTLQERQPRVLGAQS
jgi:drug/metabolite transporter (DMT)-like permease